MARYSSKSNKPQGRYSDSAMLNALHAPSKAYSLCNQDLSCLADQPTDPTLMYMYVKSKRRNLLNLA